MSKDSLSYHIEDIHEGKKNFKCEICGKLFYRAKELKDHIQNAHDIARKPDHKCEICNKTLKAQTNLRSHMLRVHGKSNLKFSCEECDKVFFSKQSLEIHANGVHSTESYKCTKCPQSYKWKQDLKLHVKKIHENFRPKTISCENCEKKFTRQISFEKHKCFRLKNENVIEYKCTFCKSAFIEQNDLKYHLHQNQCKILPIHLKKLEENHKHEQTD